MIVKGMDIIEREAFGLWVSAIYGDIVSLNPEMSFEEHKEAFFSVVEEFLIHGKIKFTTPNELWRDERDDVWSATTEEVMTYLRSRWPQDVTSERDMRLTDYFYDIPAVLWVAEDGSLIGS